MICRLQYFGVLYEFHHPLDVGGVVLEVKAHSVLVKLLHGSHELVLRCCFPIALENVPIHLRQCSLESTHTFMVVRGGRWMWLRPFVLLVVPVLVAPPAMAFVPVLMFS